MKGRAADYLVLDPVSGTYHENPEQVVRDDVEKHYWLNVGRTIVKDWRLYVMLVPMLLVFLFWRYFPMYELLGCFKVTDAVVPVNDQLFSGFSYFKRLLVGGDSLSQNFWMAMRNTFLLSFYGLCFGFPMPIILALFFNEIRSNAVRSALQVMTYLPKFMSTVVMTSLVTMLVKQGSIIGQMGIVSQALSGLGLISKEVGNAGLLNNPDYFRAIYQISGIWEEAGYGSIVFFAAIISISPTSYEAAQIDGAGKWAQMRYVVLPSILSTIVIMLLRMQSTANQVGVVARLLSSLGIVPEADAIGGLLNKPQYFRAIYQISGIWETAGYDSIVFFAAIIAISPTSYEAAQIDGAGKWAQMRYVVLPSILSTIVIMLITRIGSMLSIGYEKVILLTEGNNPEVLTTAQVISTFSWQLKNAQNAGARNTGLASAAEMMNNVVGMLLVIGSNTIARKASNVSLY